MKKHEGLLTEYKKGWGRCYTGKQMTHKFHFFDNSPAPICQRYSAQSHIPCLIYGVGKNDCCQKCWNIINGEHNAQPIKPQSH